MVQKSYLPEKTKRPKYQIMKLYRPTRYHLPFIFALTMLSACVGFHPAPERAPVDLPENFSIAGKQPNPVLWWHSFNDKELNQLIKRALRDNMDLKSVWERILEARAVAKQAGAELYPWLDISGGASHNTGRDQSKYFNQDTLSLEAMASYEVDLWGRIRKRKEAAMLDLAATEADLDTARITISSEVGLTYFQIQAIGQQLDIIARQIKDNQTSLDIISSMYEFGQTDILDTLQQKQALESTRAQWIKKNMDMRVQRNQLAVLLGIPPQDLKVDIKKRLPPIPPVPDTGLPIKLINRRPDCRSAFLRLRAANARLAQAVAEQYPRLSLTASAETDASRVNDLFENWIATIAANLLTPVFRGRSLEAEVEKREAAARQALFHYGSVVLNALREVEDALAKEAQQRRLLKNMEQRLQLSKSSLEQVKSQYEAGTVEFLRFLATELNKDSLEIKMIDEKLRLIEYRIALYRALAGHLPRAGIFPSAIDATQGYKR